MAFKMKNPSMAKLTKAAGDNRVAMKMKMEEKAAAKMKQEAAMKMKKESMAKLMDKASAMKMKEESAMKKPLVGDQSKLNEGLKKAIKAAPSKMKKDSPVKADETVNIPEVEVTADRVEKKPKNLFARELNVKRMEGGILAFKDPRSGYIVNLNAKSIAPYLASGLSNREKRMALKQLQEQGNKGREGGTATKMKKPAPTKQKMNMVKGPDGKMVPDFAVDGKGANDMKSGAKMKKPMKMKKKDSAVKMVKAVRKEQKLPKIQQTQNPPKTKKPAKQEMPEYAKRAKAKYEADLAKKKAKADAKAEFKRVEQENLKISRQRAKALGMTMKEYEKHLRSKMLKSQRKRIFGF